MVISKHLQARWPVKSSYLELKTESSDDMMVIHRLDRMSIFYADAGIGFHELISNTLPSHDPQ